MRKTILALTAVSAALLGTAMVAAPASAQIFAWDAGAFWRGAPDNPLDRIQFLKARIDHAEADGAVDHREARRVRQELSNTWQWIHQMHYDDGGHLNPMQRAEVQHHLDKISQQINWMRRDGW